MEKCDKCSSNRAKHRYIMAQDWNLCDKCYKEIPAWRR